MSARHSPPRPARRGLVIRFFSMVLGALLALAIMASMQLPFLHQPATARLSASTFVVPSTPTASVTAPSEGSAALAIPSLGVSKTWNNHVEPIASLTKMMTAYLTLRKFPLRLGQTGPCITLSAGDVSTYRYMKATDQSVALVTAGESLCEVDLLNGLLVHSADNYATLLATMVAGSTANFVNLMNQAAQSLGLFATHYADVSGFDAASVSTALDQVHLAEIVMRSPLVESIVKLPAVTLPVAGLVTSFTPFVGTNNVIGVKSGRTSAAGGCDVMAMTFHQGASTQVLYAVVLDQRGGDLLGPAGAAALALARSALGLQRHFLLAQGAIVASVGWGPRVVPVAVATRYGVWWWSANGAVPVSLRMKHLTRTIHRGDVVGWLVVRTNTTHQVALTALDTVSPPSWWQRLR